MRKTPSSPRLLGALTVPALLAGCQSAVLNPTGAVALQQRNLIFASTGLMLLIIVPVLILTAVFAWHYRKGNKAATYDPHFDHSTSLELVIWSAPLLIVILLGAMTWSSTHLLDPFRPLDRASAGDRVDPRQKPMLVQVVSLDWKWLFIYPELGIASVNELALPTNRQVRFEMTSTNMMNAFYAPSMAGMVYTMPGMTSRLHAVLNRPGDSWGYSANYSGAGFSDMRFLLRGMEPAAFGRWVAQAKAGGRPLSTPLYLQLEKPSEKVAAMRFAAVDPDLFRRIANRCARPGTPCMSDVMARDRAVGGGQSTTAEAGGGMPAGRGAPPPSGIKPEGALQKSPGEIDSVPSFTKPKGAQPPGATDPGNARNRDMTFFLSPDGPTRPSAARG